MTIKSSKTKKLKLYYICDIVTFSCKQYNYGSNGGTPGKTRIEAQCRGYDTRFFS